MPANTSPVKAPCSNCRGSHQRCDKQRPVCARCKTKGLECKPVQRKAVFRNGSTANLDTNFAQCQTWVNSKPKNWKLLEQSLTTTSVRQAPVQRTRNEIASYHEGAFGSISPKIVIQDDDVRDSAFHGAPILDLSSPAILPMSSHLPAEDRDIHRLTHVPNTGLGVNCEETSDGSPSVRSIIKNNVLVPSAKNLLAHTAFGGIQESCLVRYFIEELSPWFDHCDDRRHFQLVVPCRARHCPTLRYAICAVSSRHLCRLPQYRRSDGILYQGQLLSHLKDSSAVEYMLKCIPGLAEFPNIQDPTRQENIMAATVILRQYEEMDDESNEGRVDTDYYYKDERVNFLAVTQKIIDSMISSPLDHSLATAAYWIAIRQEVYYAFTRKTIPHLRFDSDNWRSSSIANNMIVFAGEVAQWCWSQKSPEDWTHLRFRERKLVQESSGAMEPILELKADRANGHIFPTVWYSLDVQATAVQHLQLAQMILIAENPQLEKASRAAHRRAEDHVRSIVLNVCGIALNHLRVQPCLVNAVIAITLYGDYFTDQDERDALVSIVNRTEDIHAWPMKKSYQTLLKQWELADSVEL